jgi:ABC-type lipoprotein release transport system permease subunit
MKLALKLAYRNLTGAGLRTWLNVTVLSFSFVVIIWMKGIMAGWDYQAKRDMADWQIGGGQLWNVKYDPFDPFTYEDSHSVVPGWATEYILRKEATPVLMVQGTIYPSGRMMQSALCGIDPHQKVVKIPSARLDTICDAIPAVIGYTAAKNFGLVKGDIFTVRWRNSSGMFDAADLIVADIFSCNVPAVDAGLVYVPLDRLRSMMMLGDETTLVIFSKNTSAGSYTSAKEWVFKSAGELTKSVDEVLKSKSIGQSVFYFILLLLAMLAVFDTQVLSIFRRQKEIGTYIALGYTRREVVGLFTVEGAMHSLFAAVLAALYGFPLLAWQAETGWTMPVEAGDFGMAMAQTLYPVYSLGLIATTVMIVVCVTTIVSYWPSRKIAKMNPTDALRGKIQ